MPEFAHYAWMGLVLGAASFAHCLGMCGGFVLHLSQGQAGWSALGRHLLWQAGKTSTYMLLGALSGLAGRVIGGPSPARWLQDGVAVTAGALIIVMALVCLGLIPQRVSRSAGNAEVGPLRSLLGRGFRDPSAGAALTMGLITGFLPCPVVVAGLALALESRSVPIGLATTAAMGVGTMWSLVLLGLTGRHLVQRLRRWGPTVGAVILLWLGIMTVARAIDPVHHWLFGCPRQTAAAASGGEPEAPCHAPPAPTADWP